jgi:hypothetical protein
MYVITGLARGSYGIVLSLILWITTRSKTFGNTEIISISTNDPFVYFYVHIIFVVDFHAQILKIINFSNLELSTSM